MYKFPAEPDYREVYPAVVEGENSTYIDIWKDGGGTCMRFHQNGLIGFGNGEDEYKMEMNPMAAYDLISWLNNNFMANERPVSTDRETVKGLLKLYRNAVKGMTKPQDEGIGNDVFIHRKEAEEIEQHILRLIR